MDEMQELQHKIEDLEKELEEKSRRCDDLENAYQ